MQFEPIAVSDTLHDAAIVVLAPPLDIPVVRRCGTKHDICYYPQKLIQTGGSFAIERGMWLTACSIGVGTNRP